MPDPAPAKHETKSCERCGERFECRVCNVLQCQCQTAPLSRAERARIAELYDDCLCARCLTELQAEFRAGSSGSAPVL